MKLMIWVRDVVDLEVQVDKRKIMPVPDYYAALEIPSTATPGEIKRSYRRLVRRYHPDLHSQAVDQASEAHIHIKTLNEAYAVLNNPQKRALYDAQRHKADTRRTVGQETLRYKQEQEPKMTWIEGVFGFIKELKKAIRED